eukprot:scaffold73514_cov47-Prasinocladus_malaysianus.AAC.1
MLGQRLAAGMQRGGGWGSGAGFMTGTSSFAFQGTNCSLITGPGRAVPRLQELQTWSSQRYWAAPVRRHPVVTKAIVSSEQPGIVKLQGLVLRERLAYLHGHAVQGRK